MGWVRLGWVELGWTGYEIFIITVGWVGLVQVSAARRFQGSATVIYILLV